MSRGPLALFGAIVAVGLGPALWLGVQFSNVEVAPNRPPVVSEQIPAGQEVRGGTGAGDTSVVDGDAVIRTPQRTVKRPTTTSPTASPSPSPSASDPVTVDPTPSLTPDETESPDPTGPPAGPDPTDTTIPPGDEDETVDPTGPPTPPAGEGEGPETVPTVPVGDSSGGAGAETPDGQGT